MTTVRGVKVAAAVAAGVLAACGLGGCASEDIATCSEFASMDPSTGLFSLPNDAQVSALKASLKSEGFDTGDFNVGIGYTEVLAYCNIYDGVANQNQGQPISNAH